MQPKNRLKFKIQLIQRREVWLPTLQGWAVIFLSLLMMLGWAIANIHPFLAVTAPIPANILVVEGWLPDYAVEEAIAEYQRGSYEKLITTGTPLSRGYYLAEYKNFAELTAATFLALGFDPKQLVAVPTPKAEKDRTYTSAITLRKWLSASGLRITGVNLFTLGTHTRRSWLVFRQALAPTVHVGAIAVEPRAYDVEHWWRSSEGVRTVISEVIAYLYARFVSWKT
ncbi:ElyC/SanA/YdcF family protein [Trichocoleus sp. FACHB-262]|uniref:ElyC/SanA/YdcF family protein n=1 Tax=Trichocoleus sp. FACHB-262 TaxID=2692869 RepID=UPI0016856A72|nr:ElyC/SanA/YdcF family protein [Trichocoleus sp. FACHB-262]MBD2123346.1 YdcF family protein [Trichocoleus sp. FACHB-262]